VDVVAGSVVGDSAEKNEAAEDEKGKVEGPAVGHKQQTEDESWNEERDLQAAEEVIERWSSMRARMSVRWKTVWAW
jgi:hypothetical protein